MRIGRLKKRLADAFGKEPEVHYFDGDMEYIRAYYDFRASERRDDFLIDDITWNDLDMDRVYKRINPGRCTSGEQYLYYMLRSPALEAGEFERRKQMIELAEADPKRRLKLELLLARLGRTRRADLCRAFYPSKHGIGMLLVYLALLTALLVTAAGTAFAGFSPMTILASVFVNFLVHEFGVRRSQLDYDTVNYSVNLIFAMRKLRRMHDAELDRQMTTAYESLDRLRAVLRTGGVSKTTDSGGMADFIVTLTLLDLISYEFLKNKLGRCHEDVFVIHEHLGRLDAAISVASYRASLEKYAEPELSFEHGAAVRAEIRGMAHPLLKGAVPNDLIAEKPVLITGSNASGKSTYLKTVVLAALMGQGICTVTADSYRAPVFRIYTSMALSDDLLAGESYYIAETRSLKRILDAVRGEGGAVMCAVDEVLRGTNTVERIAASAEALRALAEAGALCLAATHDIELCDLLADAYGLFHFEERLGEDRMLFDYKIRDGKATSRNAIDLLRLMGFDGELVKNAHERADRYMETGSWQSPH